MEPSGEIHALPLLPFKAMMCGIGITGNLRSILRYISLMNKHFFLKT